MARLPVKKLSLNMWFRIFGIWTLAAISMATQVYLNARQQHPESNFFVILLKQLPYWYLCALLTPFVIYYYERYPLDTPEWRKNIRKQFGVALIILAIFAHPRLLAVSLITKFKLFELSAWGYVHAFFSQLAWDLAVYVFIIVIVFADKANSRRKENELLAVNMALRNQELENQLNRAQLETLKLQLNPHFLFNTLNTVSSLIRSGEHTMAIQVNARLGNFLRTTLQAGETQFVSLEEELKFLDLYLDIESLRFSDRLIIEKQVEEDCLLVKVPYLILLPVIENAIKHGIARHSHAKRIVIAAGISGNSLNIEIYNEGKLLPEKWIAQDNWNIGLCNVYSRLKKTYDDRFSFGIENHPEGRGVQVRLKLPLSEISSEI